MGDRTSLQVYVYACPPDQAAAVLGVLAEYQLDVDWGTEEAGKGLRLDVPYTAHEISGAADEIAPKLIEAAPGCSFWLWEDPKYDWLGSMHAHTPGLGSFTAECNAEGEPVYTRDQIMEFFTADVALDDLQDHIERKLTGGLWHDDWKAADPLRTEVAAGDGG